MKPWLDDGDLRLYHGDVLDVLRSLPAGIAQTCVTSPPYWGLRDYGTGTWRGGNAECDHARPKQPDRTFTNGRGEDEGYAGSNLRAWTTRDGSTYGATCGKCGARRVDDQLGLEPTPTEYVKRMVEVFREVRRVLRDDGTLWLNIGDIYAQGHGGSSTEKAYTMRKFSRGEAVKPEHASDRDANRCEWCGWVAPSYTALVDHIRSDPSHRPGELRAQTYREKGGVRNVVPGLKPKDLVGIPWRLAFALQADGWYLRSDIIWAKPNPMPESVTDRPTKAHEYVFLFSKQPRYFYDADAVREPHDSRFPMEHHSRQPTAPNKLKKDAQAARMATRGPREYNPAGRNLRSVWTIATQPFPEAHFATYPEELVRRCILAGTSEWGGCAECGAPWRRVTSTEYENPGNRTTNGDRSLDRRHETAGFPVRLEKRSETLGWEPSCSCPMPEREFERRGFYFGAKPQLVLDPFVGSGTTALVARKHGRHAIGIDLSEEYLELAARRTQQLSLLA